MSLGKQFAQIIQRTSAFRQQLFGSDAEGKPTRALYDGTADVLCYYVPIRDQFQAVGLNLDETSTSVVRIPKRQLREDGSTIQLAFTPEVGKTIAFADGVTLRINEVSTAHPLSAEWVLGCKQL